MAYKRDPWDEMRERPFISSMTVEMEETTKRPIGFAPPKSERPEVIVPATYRPRGKR